MGTLDPRCRSCTMAELVGFHHRFPFGRTRVRRVLSIALGFAMTASAVPSAAPLPAGRAAQQTPAATGSIHGKATDSTGQPMPNYTVQLRNLADGHLAGTTSANAAG